MSNINQPSITDLWWLSQPVSAQLLFSSCFVNVSSNGWLPPISLHLFNSDPSSFCLYLVDVLVKLLSGPSCFASALIFPDWFLLFLSPSCPLPLWSPKRPYPFTSLWFFAAKYFSLNKSHPQMRGSRWMWCSGSGQANTAAVQILSFFLTNQAIWQTDRGKIRISKGHYHTYRRLPWRSARPSLSSPAHSGCKKMIFPISISQSGLNEVE